MEVRAAAAVTTRQWFGRSGIRSGDAGQVRHQVRVTARVIPRRADVTLENARCAPTGCDSQRYRCSTGTHRLPSRCRTTANPLESAEFRVDAPGWELWLSSVTVGAQPAPAVSDREADDLAVYAARRRAMRSTQASLRTTARHPTRSPRAGTRPNPPGPVHTHQRPRSTASGAYDSIESDWIGPAARRLQRLVRLFEPNRYCYQRAPAHPADLL